MEGIEAFKGRTLDLNTPVEIYRCLNRKGRVFSVRQNGKVVGHTEKFVLKNCSFIVNKAGKRRCLETKTRNVHAFIKGFIGNTDDIQLKFSHLLSYNPFSDKGFTIEDNEINNAKITYLTSDKIFIQI